jgi:hypothetical protein
VGTAYHWYILAHQHVAKQTANDYTTSLTGLKFKIAHKRAGRENWSATPRTQRKRMIMFLRGVIADLEKHSEREGAAQDRSKAPEPAARTSRAATTRASGRQRRAHEPARGSARSATRGRHGQRS